MCISLVLGRVRLHLLVVKMIVLGLHAVSVELLVVGWAVAALNWLQIGEFWGCGKVTLHGI